MNPDDPETIARNAREDLQADMTTRNEAARLAAACLFEHSLITGAGTLWPSTYDVIALAKFLLDVEDPEPADEDEPNVAVGAHSPFGT